MISITKWIVRTQQWNVWSNLIGMILHNQKNIGLYIFQNNDDDYLAVSGIQFSPCL